MRCPACGTDNRDGARFCDACGKPLQTEPVQNASSAWYRSTAAKLGLAVAGVAIVVLVVAFAIPRSSQPAASQPATPPSVVTPATPATADSNDVWAGNYIDSNGLPTVYAFCELYGWQLMSLLEQQGWMWDGDYDGWFNKSDTGALFLATPEGPLTDKGAQKLGRLAEGVPVLFSLGFTGDLYDSLDDAMAALLHVTVVDMEWSPKAILALVYGQSNTTRSLVVLTQNDNGDGSLSLFNPEAIAAGMVDEQLGGSYGSTAEEAFAALTGREANSLT